MGAPVAADRGTTRLLCGLAGVMSLAAAPLVTRMAPLGLYNITPSEPLGWYWRTGEPVRPGAVVAFRPPRAALAFLEPPRPQSFLKGVAAGPGARVCASASALYVDGRRRVAIQRADRRGRVLPHWLGCLRLRADEWLLLSDRASNSYDSRYYGPIQGRDILGVYAPLTPAVAKSPS